MHAEEDLNYFSELGLALFPVHGTTRLHRCTCRKVNCKSPGKHPIFKNWQEKATSDVDKLMSYFTKANEVNVAILTGHRSGVFVLDVDPRHNGDVSLSNLEERHSWENKGLEIQTGGGGVHLVFKLSEFDKIGCHTNLWEGLDIKGNGGFVVTAPSRHISGGKYEISKDESGNPGSLELSPPWLQEKIRKEKRQNKYNKANWPKFFTTPIIEGNRDTSLTKLVGHLVGKGVNRSIISELLHSYNQSSVIPPVSKSQVDKIIHSIDSISRKAKNE